MRSRGSASASRAKGTSRSGDGALRAAAASILAAALQAANPEELVARALRRRGRRLELGGRAYRLGRGRLFVIAAGKAALGMAAAAERVLGPALCGGLVVAPEAGPGRGRLRQLPAGHPDPDRRGQRAARAVERLLTDLRAEDVLLLLLSGGASALLPAPVQGVTLGAKAATARLLMQAGADIQELNVVRRHLSRLKGGGLARLAQPARVVALALSDVVGDDPAAIASGPVSPDPSSFADALRVCAARGVLARLPASVRRHLEAGARGRRVGTLAPGHAAFRRVQYRIIGSGRLAVAAAARAARRLGYETAVLSTRLAGEAREVGAQLGALLRRRAEERRSRPLCLLSCGETTVTVRGRGRGGRNQELALAAFVPLAGCRRPVLLASLGTDGIDGRSPAAGGLADGTSLKRAGELGLDVAGSLARNDSHTLLAALGDTLTTGPSGTNVGDVVVLLAG